jgi:alpha-tubulin suppressor-like RCC1 family protein
MPGLNVANLKFNWRGQWTSGQRYYKNDLAQWNGATYVCLQDTPDEFELAMDVSVNTNNYRMATPEFYYVDKRPDNLTYWRLVLRGSVFKRGWAPHKIYQIGDVVRYGGDLYMYTGSPGFGATATANVSNGQVVSITVTNGGALYTVPPTVTITTAGFNTVNGMGAQAYALLGTSTLSVTAATKANPVRITTSSVHGLSNGQYVGFRDIPGMTQLNGNNYFVKVVSTTQVDLYTDANQVSTLDGTNFQAFTTGSTGTLVKSDTVTSIVVTNGGSGYTQSPTVTINSQFVRNTWPEDNTYWTKVFENPNPDTRRMYAVATANMQPLGWTRNFGDHPNPQTNEGNQVAMIDALGVPYTIGGCGSSNTYNTAGRGIKSWTQTWQPAGFTFVDWLRSTDNVTSLGLAGVASTVGLPTPDGKCPKCIQWLKHVSLSFWLFNNGEVYFSGLSSNGESGDTSNSTKSYPIRVTNQSTTGWLGETLYRSFNQTKIVKLDIPSIGSSSSNSFGVYALGNDGSVWVWGYNGYGQLGLGQQTPGTVNGSSAGGYAQNITSPTRIPAQFFDYKKIVDIMSFGNEVTSVLAIDEDGDLWGWGADYYGELGLGGSPGRDNRRAIPTRIPFDFKKFGGIKKMAYTHYSTSDIRNAFILTNDGSLFGAGYFIQGSNPLQPNNNTDLTVTRWTRYINTNANTKAIENFWVVGDTRAWNMYIREKDTGLTYAMGDNWQYTLGQQANTAYWYNSGGISGNWSLVKGPRNLVHVTNNSAQSQTSTSGSSLTNVLLEESGRAWGNGHNTRGSLSLGWTTTSTFDTQMQNPETGGSARLFHPIKVPSARLTTMMGYGTSSAGTANDLGLYITDDGQALYAGTDGTAQNGTPNVQGAIGLRWYVQNIGNPGPFNRVTMHSQMGD